MNLSLTALALFFVGADSFYLPVLLPVSIAFNEYLSPVNEEVIVTHT